MRCVIFICVLVTWPLTAAGLSPGQAVVTEESWSVPLTCTNLARQFQAPANLDIHLNVSRTAPGVLRGSFDASLFNIGWDVLRYTTNASYGDEVQAYAAGFYEGYATAERILQWYENMYVVLPNGTRKEHVLGPLKHFFDDHQKYVATNVAQHKHSSDLWYQVGLEWESIRGLLVGVNCVLPAQQHFTYPMLMMVVANGDLFDLQYYFNHSYDLDRVVVPDRFVPSHCTGSVKLAYDLSDIYFGHTTWYRYNSMSRVYKVLEKNFNHPSTSARRVSFSSYPGSLASQDDFYVTDANLAVIETTLQMYNLSVYKHNIRPESLLYFERVAVANRMAANGTRWADIFSTLNSGTYNDQWMVVDLNKFEPYQQLKPWTFTVLEQTPGEIKYADRSDVLAYGYFPSYNVPSFPEIFRRAGFPAAVKQRGPAMHAYDTAVRAEIFRRNQSTVHSLTDFRRLMRYNNYAEDPISQGNPMYAIAARADLNSTAPLCFGGVDTKVASWSSWMREGQSVWAVAGPTHDQQPAFEFSTTKAVCDGHAGIPDRWDFDFQLMQP